MPLVICQYLCLRRQFMAVEVILQVHFFKLILQTTILSTTCAIGLSLVPQNPIDVKSTLLQVMAWCHQAPSHNLSQCWPRRVGGWVGGWVSEWVSERASEVRVVHISCVIIAYIRKATWKSKIKNKLTFNVPGPSYLSHDIDFIEWVGLCRNLRKDFNHLCHINVEEWHKM